MSRRPPPDLSLPTVFADFNGVDAEGCLWLHFDQTAADLREHDLVMADGLRLIASDGDIATEVVVCRGPKDHWRGRVVSELLYLR